ncbi:MAG: hypothetical protein HZC44_08445 [Geobacter sp.]|nr:hypothetical protein [Geobacter sp.]
MIWPRLQKGLLLQRLRLKESWVIFFLLGIIMMNVPFIGIFNKPVTIFGVPLLYLYLQLGWLVSILFISIFTKSIDQSDDGEKK